MTHEIARRKPETRYTHSLQTYAGVPPIPDFASGREGETDLARCGMRDAQHQDIAVALPRWLRVNSPACIAGFFSDLSLGCRSDAANLRQSSRVIATCRRKPDLWEPIWRAPS
jgi:hypothetical protein